MFIFWNCNHLSCIHIPLFAFLRDKSLWFDHYKWGGGFEHVWALCWTLVIKGWLTQSMYQVLLLWSMWGVEYRVVCRVDLRQDLMFLRLRGLSARWGFQYLISGFSVEVAFCEVSNLIFCGGKASIYSCGNHAWGGASQIEWPNEGSQMNKDHLRVESHLMNQFIVPKTLWLFIATCRFELLKHDPLDFWWDSNCRT